MGEVDRAPTNAQLIAELQRTALLIRMFGLQGLSDLIDQGRVVPLHPTTENENG